MDRTGIIISDRITIGISACCMGSPVRYNAKGWDMLAGMGRERNDFKWCPVCPECAAGLGVPRDPIHLTGGDGSMVWRGETEVKNRHGRLVTEDVMFGALSCLKSLRRAGALAYVYMEGQPDEAFMDEFKAQALDILRKPSTTKRITNSLWKNYSYYRKRMGKTVEGINTPDFQRNITTIAKELVTMERKALDDQVLFGTSPVMYR